METGMAGYFIAYIPRVNAFEGIEAYIMEKLSTSNFRGIPRNVVAPFVHHECVSHMATFSQTNYQWLLHNARGA